MTIKKIEDKIELWFVKNDVKEKKKNPKHNQKTSAGPWRQNLLFHRFYNLSDLALKW